MTKPLTAKQATELTRVIWHDTAIVPVQQRKALLDAGYIEAVPERVYLSTFTFDGYKALLLHWLTYGGWSVAGVKDLTDRALTHRPEWRGK